MKILIVDDDLVDRKALTRVLKKNIVACEVVEVETVDESLIVLKQQKFDVVFLDYNLPQRSGLDLLLEINGDGCVKNTVFIMISTDEEHRLSQACREAGARGFLAKTALSSATLKQAISKAQADLAIS